jgi:nucleotide-binding universal stress UspA family protein
MKAPCSVCMVPEGTAASLRRILVPIDFSDHAADTMRVAVALARLTGQAEVFALHVYFNAAVATYESYDEVLQGDEEEAFRRFMAPIDCQGVRVTPLFEEGANIAHVINRMAEKHWADLVVMGSRGRSRSAAILLGSVTEETIIETKRPLLVVKHFGSQLGLLQALVARAFSREGNAHFD